MSALDELLEMEKERKERIRKINSLIRQLINEEGKRLCDKLIEKMRNGEFGFAEELAVEAGFNTSYDAMCTLVHEEQNKFYHGLSALIENEFWSYHLPYEIIYLLREIYLQEDTVKDTAKKDLKAIEEHIRRKALDYAMEEFQTSEPYDDTNDSEDEEDTEDYDEDEEDEEETTLEDNWYFSSLCEKMSAALLGYCNTKKSNRLNEYVNTFLRNLSMFERGEDIETSFSFYIMKRFSVNGNQDHESLNITLHSDEFIVSKGGYVHGPYGGDSYTDWRMFFWPNGGMDLPIDESYELERYNEIIDSIEDAVNGKRAEFYIETPDEYYANPVDDDYDNEEDED